MDRLRALGVNLLGTRNRATADLVTEVPPPLAADALGYSHQVAFKHAEAASGPWTRYVGRPLEVGFPNAFGVHTSRTKAPDRVPRQSPERRLRFLLHRRGAGVTSEVWTATMSTTWDTPMTRGPASTNPPPASLPSAQT